jgi:phosphoglycerate transport regulatory protein PgtC
VGMSAPSRSGTTHLTLEAILQGEGWDKGWATMKEMAGNFKTITERSFGVPDGVNSGEFGIGIVIDFFGFSSRASGFPVDFVYPKVTALVPANVGMVKDAPHPKAAAAFIDYLLSDEGQELLFDPKIQRLPVKPAIYAKAPAGLPNPFKDTSIGASVKFDAELSEGRYNLVNSLFDQLITFRLDELTAATKAIQEADAALAKKPNAKAQALLDQARQQLVAMPVTEAQANDPAFARIFEKKRKKATDVVPQRQAEVEQKWDAFAREHYSKAVELAKQARSLAK